MNRSDSRSFTLTLLDGEYAIARLDARAPLPVWADGESGVSAITRTPDELSILVPAARVPPEADATRGWRGLVVHGPFPFETVGVMATLSFALADAEVSLLAVSTFDTDYFFVQARDLARAIDALRARGHRVNE
jgi:hypothetical protein